MSTDERFFELWNDYLEGELDESGIVELQALVAGDERLSQMAVDSYQVHRLLGLIAQDSASRQDDFVRETLARLPADSPHFVHKVMQHLPQKAPRKDAMAWRLVTKWSLAIAAAAVVTFMAGLYFQRPSAERRIAKVAGLSGALQWTGNGGRVVRNLTVGTDISGGTIEGMTPDSWFELKFNDGSNVAFSGNSMLTFSDNGQKKLHLKEGTVSGNVKPQPAGRPMLIYTRSAVLEVLGTQFEVEAGLAATMLDVSKGIVRVRRLSDGATVDVPAKHRVIAATDREMLPIPIPASVNRWRSQLQRGPDRTLGKWSVPTGEQGASISTVPYTTEQGKTIFTLGFGVSCGNQPPVILEPGTHLRVRGRIASSHPVFFGLTVRQENGAFAGKFQTIRPAGEFTAGQTFEALLDLRDFGLDPSLRAWKDKLPGSPFHLVVESTWCHTLDKQAGLEIAEVELIPPVEEK